MKSKRRKIFYVALSILIAATIWFYVNNKESVTVYVHDVPIEFLNEDTSLADKGLMRISGDEDITVDLKLQMPRNVVYDFDTSELRLVSDLSTITYAGKQSVSYTILYPSKVSSSSVKVESPTIRTVQVEIGELNKKDIEIRCKVVGNVAEGYIAGTVEMLPETLEVRGQQADIMQISYAQVTLDIENASSTVVELLDYELYDFNDQLIESKNIHPMSENVQVTMPVLKVKDVPLTVNFIESAGSRLENYTYTLSHSSIPLSGDATQMAGISEISLGTLALEDVQGSETLTYDILIPDGVNNLSGITSATLTISSGDISTKEVEATHFSYENFSGDHTVTVVTSSLPVTLRGASSDLDAIYRHRRRQRQLHRSRPHRGERLRRGRGRHLRGHRSHQLSQFAKGDSMTQIATVEKILPGGMAEISVPRKSACGHDCEECAGCGVSGASVRAVARNDARAEVGQKVVVESSTKNLLGVMLLVYLLPIVLFLVGYFATGALESEGLRYAVAIAAFLVGIIPAIICDRRTKKNGKLTFTIVRLF